MLKYLDSHDLNCAYQLLPRGAESNVYVLKYKKAPSKVYKAFASRTTKETLKNKERKLILLDERKKYLKDACLPLNLVKYPSSQTISGYTSNYYLGNIFEISSCGKKISIDDSIAIFKLIKQRILEYKEQGVYYYDYNLPNILYRNDQKNKHEIKIIDMDNVQVEHLPSDVYNLQVGGYLQNGGELKDKCLTFAFNEFTRKCFQSYLKRNLHATQSCEIKQILNDLQEQNHDCLADHEFLLDYIEDNSKVLKKTI